uniref:Ribonuclease H-like domain-containing protein n=1 Tax=Tanacetum cinerariifolium TaxID=118510 RepID=A0A6L2LXD6_TANCI|nr:ribonuclease H-like domain-containing protein [Tanacetum cinerariifolium]
MDNEHLTLGYDFTYLSLSYDVLLLILYRDEFPLPEEVLTVSEVPLLKKRDATTEKIALLMKTEKFRIQQYLQHEHYALWEVIEFRDSYEVSKNDAATGSASEGTATKKGRTVAVTTEDMQKRRNDVKARTTLLLALPDEHQLRFSKYKTVQELWAAILETFGGNKATKKTKKNLLKQQYGNFKAKAKNNSGNGEVNTADIPIASTQVSPADINQIDEDDIEEMDIKWNMALLSIRAGRYWKKTRKKISIQSTNVVGFDKSKVECFNFYKMGHSAGECRAPRSKTGEGETTIDKEENHAFVADEEAPTEFALMAKTSVESEVEARLVEFKNQEIKFCEKIKGLELKVEFKTKTIKCLTNELELLNKEKEGLNSKLTDFQSASKDQDNLLESHRSDKNKEGLGYSPVPPSCSSRLSSQEGYVLDRNP